jgi:hypothetical protein
MDEKMIGKVAGEVRTARRSQETMPDKMNDLWKDIIVRTSLA